VSLNYELIPTAVFCQPNVATVGLTEEQARQRFGDDIAIFATDFKPLKHTLSGANERCLLKLVVNRSDDKVVGAHMVGHEAGEIIQGIAIAMVAGATKTTAEEFVTLRQERSNKSQ
jgi:glutathione reductase (NADPH)